MNGGTEEIFVFSNSVADATAYEPTYTVSNVNLIVGQVDPGAAYESSMMKRMKEGGVIKSDFCRDPIKPLDIDTKNLLINFAKKYDLLTFKWGK